jgi:hypothetical protein
MNVPSAGLPELEDAKSFIDALDQRVSETTLVPLSKMAQHARTGDDSGLGADGSETLSAQLPLPPAQSAPLIVDPIPTLPYLELLDAPIVRNDSCIIDFHDDGQKYLCTEQLDTINEKLTRIQEDMYIGLQGILLLLNKYDLLDALELALAVAGVPVPMPAYVRAALGGGVMLDYARRQLPPTGDPIHDVQNGLAAWIEGMQIMWERLKKEPDSQHMGILKDDLKKVTPWLVGTIGKLKEEIAAPFPDDPQAQLEARVRKPQAEEQLKQALDLLQQLNQLSNELLSHDLPVDPELLDEAGPHGPVLEPTSFHVLSIDPMNQEATLESTSGSPGQTVSVTVEPIKLEILVHDHRLEFQATQGHRRMAVDMRSGPRMIGYLNV